MCARHHCQLQTISSVERLLIRVNSSFHRQLWSPPDDTYCLYRLSLKTVMSIDSGSLLGKRIHFSFQIFDTSLFLTFNHSIYFFMIFIIQSRSQKVQSGLGNYIYMWKWLSIMRTRPLSVVFLFTIKGEWRKFLLLIESHFNG